MALMVEDGTQLKTEKATWSDFTLEEHVRAYVGMSPDSIFRMYEVWKGVYRINIIDKQSGRITKSKLLKVVATPEGYVFRESVSESRSGQEPKQSATNGNSGPPY